MSEGLRLLLVEDNPGDVRLIEEMVKEVPDAGCEIACAGTVREAVEALSRQAVDAILLDLSLPDAKGLVTLQRVRAAANGTPIVVLTGLGDDSTAIRAVQDGAQDYLVKGNFDGRMLLRSIRYAVERARAEKVERERRGLESALGAMDHLLAVIGHELRTPLTSLRVLSEYMLTDHDSAAVEWEKLVSSINSEVIRMTDMVNNLLEAARLDSGISQWNWGQVDLQVVCSQVRSVLDPLVDSSRLVLSVRNVPGGVVFPGDPDAIRRLLVNLVNNAIRHTNSGQIDIDARRYNVEGQQWVQIRVRDSGSGMSDDVIARLGTAFATNKGVAGSSLSGGTGLGLAICKGIAGAHGGQITVSSEPNCGSVFTVNLRADLTEPVPIPADLKILREAAA